MRRLRSRQLAWLAATSTIFPALAWACLAGIVSTAWAATWSATGSMGTPRDGYTSTLLSSGRVLVAGGANTGVFLASAELYDPATGTFSATGPMGTARYNPIAALLPNGMVLIAGGTDSSGNPLAIAELFNPATGTFTATGSMGTARHNPSATRLLNGMVLVAGGTGAGGPLASAELYNPATGTFTATGPMGTPREWHMLTLLTDGKVLVSGGSSNTDFFGNPTPLSSAELYNPATGAFSPTGSMRTQRYNPTANLLNSGKVLVAGGYNLTGGILQTAELYDPSAGAYSLTTGGKFFAVFNTTATLLPDGTVLFAGGEGPISVANSASELYDPGTGFFYPTASMGTSRYNHYATDSKSILLPNGQVLVAGGFAGGSLASAELYDPGIGIPSITSVSPVAGPVGSPVTIAGSGFGALQGGSSVTFNGTTAVSITSWSDTQIQLAVPANATPGPVVVTVAGTSSNGMLFTVTAPPPPVIGSISPVSGTVGSPVTIAGSGFGALQGGSTVTFNGTTAGAATSWSDTQILVTVPAGATTGPVVVIVAGTPSNGKPFTVQPPQDPMFLLPPGGGGGGCAVVGTRGEWRDGVGAFGAYLLMAVCFGIRRWTKRKR